MVHFLKTFAWIAVLVAAATASWAFSIGGPFNDTSANGTLWQVRDLGYNIGERGDIMGPHNLGEEYRRNIITNYYSYDQSFLDYYGSNGVWNVDQAFAILNSLQPVSSYSTDLSEVPLDTRRDNFRAAALNLFDLKSEILSIMIEQMGLTDPRRYVWCLHNRNAGAACPIGNDYFVIKRNFDIVDSDLNTLQYSSYINGVLFSYFIKEYCANPPLGSGLSEALSFPVDPVGLVNFQPVASLGASPTTIGLLPGYFFTGLTRDDIGGLRYLYRAGNINWEGTPTNTVVFVTNSAPGNLSLLTTSNLTDLVSASLTNTDAQLLALFPNLQITSTLPSLQTMVVTNPVAYFTNYPWNPVGLTTLVVTNTYTTNVIFVFQRTFGNIVTNFLNLPNGFIFTNNNVFTNGTPLTTAGVTIITTNIGTSVGTNPYGFPNSTNGFTNITVSAGVQNQVMGDFFIIPTNTCDFLLLSNVLTRTFAITNTLVATNPVVNGTAATNISFFSQTFITYWTNHSLAYFPITCPNNEVTLRRGVEKIYFVRRDFDSALGQFFYPQTNTFHMTIVTNSRDVVETYQRVATQPDFLIAARDLTVGPAGGRFFQISTRNINYNTNNELAALAGPGTIQPSTLITLDKTGPVFFNESTNQFFFLDELTQIVLPTWASFDDSTNAPVLYPDGTSIANLENMVLLQLLPTSAPAGQVGVAYNFQFGGAGGQPPYAFTLAPLSPAVPPGLNLAADGSGVLSGTPSVDNTYDFIVRITDSNGRFADWQVTLTINP
jgi:hypothetical protein